MGALDHEQLGQRWGLEAECSELVDRRLCRGVVSAHYHMCQVLSSTASRHIQAFAAALEADELALDQLDTSSPQIPGTPGSPSSQTRVRKVTALSDFAPVNLKVRKFVRMILWLEDKNDIFYITGVKEMKEMRKNGWIGSFLPYVGHFWYAKFDLRLASDSYRHYLECFIFLIIAAEFGFYVLIRQLVNTKEWITACKSFHLTNPMPI